MSFDFIESQIKALDEEISGNLLEEMLFKLSLVVFVWFHKIIHIN